MEIYGDIRRYTEFYGEMWIFQYAGLAVLAEIFYNNLTSYNQAMRDAIAAACNVT